MIIRLSDDLIYYFGVPNFELKKEGCVFTLHLFPFNTDPFDLSSNKSILTEILFV